MCCCTFCSFCTCKQHVWCTQPQVSSFPLMYLYCVYHLYLHMTHCDSIVYFTFLSRTPQLKDLIRRRMLLIYKHHTYMPTATSNGYYLFWLLLYFPIIQMHLLVFQLLLNSNCLQIYRCPTYWPKPVLPFPIFPTYSFFKTFPFFGNYFKEKKVVPYKDFFQAYTWKAVGTNYNACVLALVKISWHITWFPTMTCLLVINCRAFEIFLYMCTWYSQIIFAFI